jgi:hypothetical protein
VPRDRDQALVRYDGFVTGLFGKVNPKLVTFGPDFPANLAGFTWNGRELDRAFLAPLDSAAFDSVAGALVGADGRGDRRGRAPAPRGAPRPLGRLDG